MRAYLVLIVVAWTQSIVAATFVGQGEARFVVTETLDGTTTSVEKWGPISFILNTNYSQIEWSMDFDVDLLMSGGPTQQFETRLQAQGTITTDAPSPLSFPDATGVSSGGLYNLDGTAEWVFTERIVTATDVHESGPQIVDHTWNRQQGFNVASYPSHVSLNHFIGSFTNPAISLGQITLGTNNYLDVVIRGLNPSNSIQLTEVMPGDFNGDSAVDTADYIAWRRASGPVAPFLAQYDVWTANYGESAGAGGSSTNIPEPSSITLFALAMLGIGFRWRR